MQSNSSSPLPSSGIRGLPPLVGYGLACGCGLLSAWLDVAAPFGDDTEKATFFLWLGSSALLGLLWPRRAWRWPLLVAPWVPAAHFLRHALGLADAINPNTYTTIALLVPVSLAVCGIGAGGGWLIRFATYQEPEPRYSTDEEGDQA